MTIYVLMMDVWTKRIYINKNIWKRFNVQMNFFEAQYTPSNTFPFKPF
jgi:hypothetical protein